MRWRGLVALTLCAALAAAASAHASALDEVRDCARHVDSDVQGAANLEAACPGIVAALTTLGIPGVLQADWRDSLRGSELEDLGELAARYEPRLAHSAPDTSPVAGILLALAHEQPPVPHSWWQRLKQWLRSLLDNKPPQTEDSWLARWLATHSLPALATRILFYCLLGAIVIAALVVVLNELKAAGLLTRSEEGPRPVSGRVGSLTYPPGLNVQDLERAALQDQPGILLRLLVARLHSLGDFPVDRNLTHRELIAVTRLTTRLRDGAQRERFAGVATLAERVFYGGRQVQEGPDHDALREGRSLLQQLELSSGSAA